MIFDKPFVWAEMLRRTIFKGRTNFFNAKDFNKELETIHNFMEAFNASFGVTSNVEFTVPSFGETFNIGTDEWTRTININWTNGEILYKGTKFQIATSGITGYTQVYANPSIAIAPKEVKPPTYIVLTADLVVVTYGDSPALCGIQSDETPASVPTVDVEQFQNIEIKLTNDPTDVGLGNVVCILATIHPRYNVDGSANGFGFLYNTFKNPDFKRFNGAGNEVSSMNCNQSLFEYIMERVTFNMSNLLNERQLIRRFNFADLENFVKARFNLGFSNLVNHRQLVQAENLADLTNVPLARQNLGLGNASMANFGFGAGDAIPASAFPVGMITMWNGSPSSVPTGWKLCDGTSGTPDLRGKFIVGMDTAQTEFNLLGKTGGAKGYTLSHTQIPPHKHKTFFFSPEDGNPWRSGSPDYVDLGGEHWILGDRADTPIAGNIHWQAAGSKNTYGYTTNSGDGTSNVTSLGQLKASPDPVSALPPYYALCYIMFVGGSIAPPATIPTPAPLTYPNFSTPDGANDNGYSTYTPVPLSNDGTTSVGSGIILTNPE